MIWYQVKCNKECYAFSPYILSLTHCFIWVRYEYSPISFLQQYSNITDHMTQLVLPLLFLDLIE